MAGRHKIEYTDEQRETVDKLAMIGCTMEEIAAITGIPKRSLDRHFGVIKKAGFEKFKGSIRRQQFKLLQNGNATMGVWLGKQYLGQKDRQDITSNDETIGSVEVTIRRRDAKTKA